MSSVDWDNDTNCAKCNDEVTKYSCVCPKCYKGLQRKNRELRKDNKTLIANMTRFADEITELKEIIADYKN